MLAAALAAAHARAVLLPAAALLVRGETASPQPAPQAPFSPASGVLASQALAPPGPLQEAEPPHGRLQAAAAAPHRTLRLPHHNGRRSMRMEQPAPSGHSESGSSATASTPAAARAVLAGTDSPPSLPQQARRKSATPSATSARRWKSPLQTAGHAARTHASCPTTAALPRIRCGRRKSSTRCCRRAKMRRRQPWSASSGAGSARQSWSAFCGPSAPSGRRR